MEDEENNEVNLPTGNKDNDPEGSEFRKEPTAEPSGLIEKNTDFWDRAIIQGKKDMSKLGKIIRHPQFIFWSSMARFGLVIGIVLLIGLMIKEIEAVKLLGTDACAVCMNQTGVICSTIIRPFG